MSVKKNNNASVKQLENKLKNAQMLNYILIAVCAVLLVVCIVLAASSCGTGKDLPSESTVPVSQTASSSNIVGTYQYVSADDTYGFAVEFTADGVIWFYEATKDESLVQGFVGEFANDASASDADASCIKLYYIDGYLYTTANVEINATADGGITITQVDENALLTDRIPVGETVSLTPVENYSLDQVVVGLYADQMAE